MFSHVTVGARAMRKLARFHDTALAPLGLRRRETAPDGGPPATRGNGCMGAFVAPSTAAGSADEGAPGARPHCGEGYCGAHLRDPEGNKPHPVRRGDMAVSGAV